MAAPGQCRGGDARRAQQRDTAHSPAEAGVGSETSPPAYRSAETPLRGVEGTVRCLGD